jgi:putative acetyltransferase
LLIRNQTEIDNTAIEKITIEAFKDHPFSSHTEQYIIRELRSNNNLPVSLVAEVDDIIVGHIAFSLVSISSGSKNWYGLGPVSVKPEFQSQGIGSKLIKQGIEQIKALGANGCVVLGEPEYYGRFGFKVMQSITLEGVPPEYFQTQVFQGSIPSGVVKYDAAFEAKN